MRKKNVLFDAALLNWRHNHPVGGIFSNRKARRGDLYRRMPFFNVRKS
jgi:hypothetical protein